MGHAGGAASARRRAQTAHHRASLPLCDYACDRCFDRRDARQVTSCSSPCVAVAHLLCTTNHSVMASSRGMMAAARLFPCARGMTHGNRRAGLQRGAASRRDGAGACGRERGAAAGLLPPAGLCGWRALQQLRACGRVELRIPAACYIAAIAGAECGALHSAAACAADRDT